MANRRLTGTVVKKSGDQTLKVSIVRSVMHPIYRKRYNVTKHYAVHDGDNKHKAGETITFEACRPMSARKRWIVVAGDKT